MPAGTTFPLHAQPSNGMQDPSTTSFAIATDRRVVLIGRGEKHETERKGRNRNRWCTRYGAAEARLFAGFIGGADSHPGYSASKGAVRIFTKSAAVRFGLSGVRVNSVHPGHLPPMLDNTNAAGHASKAAVTPLRRLGEAMDVAFGVLVLASDEASPVPN
jgi:NAD(P)-dependent dehydrogenase (short-subunit alcohol dehydrogenase family)